MKKNRSSQRAVVLRALHVRDRHCPERVPYRTRVRPRHDPALGEHDEMRVVDGHQRRKQLRLGVLEVLVEDEADVGGVERHISR